LKNTTWWVWFDTQHTLTWTRRVHEYLDQVARKEYLAYIRTGCRHFGRFFPTSFDLHKVSSFSLLRALVILEKNSQTGSGFTVRMVVDVTWVRSMMQWLYFSLLFPWMLLTSFMSFIWCANSFGHWDIYSWTRKRSFKGSFTAKYNSHEWLQNYIIAMCTSPCFHPCIEIWELQELFYRV
jgi:hypothetical protein